MNDDADILRAANSLMQEHGATGAKLIATQRADVLLADGDTAGQFEWRRIVSAIDELQRTTSSDRERVDRESRGGGISELAPSWRRVLAICWLLTWRGTLGAFVTGGIVTFLIIFGGTLIVGVHAPILNVISRVAALLVGLMWGFFVVRVALKKKFHDFRIALLPPGED